MTVVREQEIARYVDEVRQALADLPPTVRDELLEDLPEHLAEVAAEADGSLADRIGTPQAYAAELRTAAGAAAPPATPKLDQRIADAVIWVRDRLQAIDVRLGPAIGHARASEFLRLLRPAWWVLRGYLVAMLLTVMSTSTFGLVPQFEESVLAGLLVLAGSVIGSIWLGRRSPGLRRWPRLAVNAGTALLMIFGLVSLVDLESRADVDGYYQPSYNDPYTHIQDVYVYDNEGRLVEEARLFDQNGEPIRLGNPWCDEAIDKMPEVDQNPIQRTYPYCPEQAPFRLPAVEPSDRESPEPRSPAPAPSPDPSPDPSTDPSTDPSVSPAADPSPAGPSPGPSDPSPQG